MASLCIQEIEIDGQPVKILSVTKPDIDTQPDARLVELYRQLAIEITHSYKSHLVDGDYKELLTNDFENRLRAQVGFPLGTYFPQDFEKILYRESTRIVLHDIVSSFFIGKGAEGYIELLRMRIKDTPEDQWNDTWESQICWLSLVVIGGIDEGNLQSILTMMIDRHIEELS